MKLPCIDIGSMCVDCGRDTSMGNGLFVDRLPSDKTWSINDQFEIEVDGYLCRDCQLLDCDTCKAAVLDYELKNNSVICIDCLEKQYD